MKRALLAGLALCVVACGSSSSSPSAPSVPSIAGTWAGSSTDSVLGAGGQITMTLAQSASNVSGTWSSTASNGFVTETFTGTVIKGGLDVHTFRVSAAGAVSITLTAAGPPSTIAMGLGIGNPDAAGNCVFLSGGTTIAQAGAIAQLAGTLTTVGTYCVAVVDVGNAVVPVTYSVSVKHPFIGSNSGTLTGTLSGSSVSAVLAPSNPLTCSTSATATVNGNQMSGTYATINCTVAESGSFVLTKQ